MITRIREVRRAQRLTLEQVAFRCVPPTTAQTIGRLETGTRTLSVAWLNRIASALGVEAADLVILPALEDFAIAALLDERGAAAPPRALAAVAPRPEADHVAIQVKASVGDYRSGDEIWLKRLAPHQYAAALNRDVLAPRPGDRYLFGRLIGREPGRLQILPPGAGQRQTVVREPEWLAVATRLIRSL